MTKSDNYIPTHFLYFSPLFFLLIFMYQQTHCLTLPKPFFKIFFFRIYAPTIQTYPRHIDPVFAETSVPAPQIPTPIQPTQTNPPATHKYTRHEFHAHTHHRFRAHTVPHTTIQPHRHTRRRPRPPTLTLSTLTPSPPQAGLQSGLQAGCRRSPLPVRNSIGQVQDQATQKQTVSGHSRNWTGQAPNRPHTGSD